jgi:hypothetical protein
LSSRDAAKQARVSITERSKRPLTITEHLIIGELPIFGKKNPKLEVHRALTKDNRRHER